MSESGESDIRKRAAWLLAMLAVVALLFAALMVTVMGGNTGHSPHTVLGDDPIRSLSAGPRPTPKPTTHQPAEHGSAAGSTEPGTTPPADTSSTSTGPAPNSCPSSAPCTLDGDIGNAIAAVNAFRSEHGKPAVPGTVSATAQQCAVSNGSDCSGSWAESQVATADGQAALAKVASLAHDLDKMTSFEIGWAYDPAGHQYFFAIVQNS